MSSSADSHVVGRRTLLDWRDRVRGLAMKGPLAFASLGALAVYGFGAGVSFVAQTLAARLLGVESYGEYTYVLAWLLSIASVSTLGFHISLLRLVPASLAQEDWARAAGAIQSARLCALGASLAVSSIGILVAVVVFGSSESTLLRTVIIGLVALPFLTMQLVMAAVVRAYGGVSMALAPERIIRDGAWIILMLLASIIVSDRLGSEAAIAAMLVSSILIVTSLAFVAKRIRPPELAKHAPAFELRQWLSVAPSLIIVTLADNLLSRSGVLVLGLTGRTREAGIFALAFGISQLAALPRMAVATMFAPTVAELHARQDGVALQALVTRAAILSLLGTLIVATLLMVFAENVIDVIGPDFRGAVPAILVLIVGQLLCAAFGPQQHLITMTGHEHAAAFLQTLSALGCVLLCLVTSVDFGILGVAISVSVSLAGWNIAMACFIATKLNLLPGLALVCGKSLKRRESA